MSEQKVQNYRVVTLRSEPTLDASDLATPKFKFRLRYLWDWRLLRKDWDDYQTKLIIAKAVNKIILKIQQDMDEACLRTIKGETKG